MADFINKILKDVQVELTEAYQMNFRRKAFFSGAPWKPTKRPVARGALMLRSGNLYDAAGKSKIEGESIVFRFDMPYAKIHNEGGKAGRNLSATIPQRQFIGDAPEVEKIIKENIEDNLPDLINNYLNQQFNNG